MGILADTQKRLAALYEAQGTWRKLAQYLDVPHRVLHAIYKEDWSHVSWDSVRLIRKRLGMSDPGELRYVIACPTCGQVHGEGIDCHGQPVADVVILRPGERVMPTTRPTKCKRGYTSIAVPAELRERLNEIRKARGITWSQLLAEVTRDK